MPKSAHLLYRQFLAESSPPHRRSRDPASAVVRDTLKRSRRGEVMLIQHAGKPMVEKTFYRSWKDWFRPSRARKAWAACRMMQALDLPTVTPVAYTDSLRASCFLYEYLDDAITVREWLKSQMHKAPEATRHQIADELLELLLSLYRAGVYHGDAKAGNLLVQYPNHPARRRYAWIDLEAVVPLSDPTAAQICRNLVQLNGAIGRKIPRADRQRFLDRLGETYEWARRPGLIDELEQETHTRLMREVRRECGH